MINFLFNIPGLMETSFNLVSDMHRPHLQRGLIHLHLSLCLHFHHHLHLHHFHQQLSRIQSTGQNFQSLLWGILLCKVIATIGSHTLE